jgi:hypothetical protein
VVKGRQGYAWFLQRDMTKTLEQLMQARPHMGEDSGQASRALLVLGPDDRHAVHVFDSMEVAPRDSISEGHF